MTVWDILAVTAAVATIIVFFFVVSTGNPARYTEDDARSFYDEHGHWPDETPEQAAARDADARAAMSRAEATTQAARDGAASVRVVSPDDEP